MILAGISSITKHGMLCVALACVLAVETTYVHCAKTNARNHANKSKSLIQEIKALGPLAASKEDLAACEATFGDNFKSGQSISNSTFSGKTRMTLELTRLLSMNGLENDAASTAAATLVNVPEAIHAITLIAKTEKLHLRSIKTVSDADKHRWIIDASCAGETFPELLATLGRLSSGIALDAIDMRGNGSNDIDLRLELRLPKTTAPL